MNQKNKMAIVAVALLLAGGLLGYFISERNYGAGPLASIQGLKSSANRGTCADATRQLNFVLQQFRGGNPSFTGDYLYSVEQNFIAACGRDPFPTE